MEDGKTTVWQCIPNASTTQFEKLLAHTLNLDQDFAIGNFEVTLVCVCGGGGGGGGGEILMIFGLVPSGFSLKAFKRGSQGYDLLTHSGVCSFLRG